MLKNITSFAALIFGILLLCTHAVFAKPRKKPQVLVYGNSIAAYTAAVQSAKSGLNTIWVTGSDKSEILTELFATPLKFPSYSLGQNYESGIWREILLQSYKGKTSADSILYLVKSNPNAQLIKNALEAELQKYSNLQVFKKSGIRKLTRSKKTWTLQMQDRSAWKVRTIVDASLNAELTALTKIQFESRLNLTLAEMCAPHQNPWAKTTIASSSTKTQPVLTIPMAQLVPKDSSNFYPLFTWNWAQTLQQEGHESISIMAQIGQSLGAIAGFAAFFKIENNKLDTRQIQGELIQYQDMLLPFQDVGFENPNWQAIQRVNLSGLLLRPASEGPDTKGGINFYPEHEIKIEEIAPALKQLFSRSQIWLADNPSGTLTMQSLLELIQQIGQRGQELEGQVRKSWTRKYQWKKEIDLQAPATREEFAVLFDEYCKPFEIKIGFQGQVIR